MATLFDICAVIGAVALAAAPVTIPSGVLWVVGVELVGLFAAWYAAKHLGRLSPWAARVYHGGWACLAVVALLPYLRAAVGV